MEEAEYCDRVVILDAGRVLAQGTPAEIRARGHAEEGREPTMEDAFIAIVEEAAPQQTSRRAQEARVTAMSDRDSRAAEPETSARLGADASRRAARSSATRAASPSAS